MCAYMMYMYMYMYIYMKLYIYVFVCVNLPVAVGWSLEVASWPCDVFCVGSTLATQWVGLLKHFFLGKLRNTTLPVTLSMVRGLWGVPSGSKFPTRYDLEFELL